MSVNKSTFPDTVWDGLAPSLADREQDKAADAPISDQHSAEIIAVQEFLKMYADLLRLIGNPNTVLGVNNAGTALEFKELIAGSNVTVQHAAGSITFSASGGGGSSSIPLTNDNASPIVIGQPVWIDVNDHIDLAIADDQTKVEVVGLVKDTSIASNAAGNIQFEGILTATTGQWDAVTGESGGLDWTQVYYLDPTTPGMLTQTPPAAVGKFVVRIGKALSATELEIRIAPPIKL